MKTFINIDNYEEIMFRLVEDDFDGPTRIDLLRQIESDALFKFEWESWQITKFVDPLENYAVESSELTEKIVLITEPQTVKRRFFYYWATAASIILIIGTLFLLTSDFTSMPKPEVVEVVKKSLTPIKPVIEPIQNCNASIAITDRKQTRNQGIENISLTTVVDSNKIVPNENTLAEIPKVIDSIPIKSNELAKAPGEKPRYTITIETSDISGLDQQNIDFAQNEKFKFSKVFTNTKLFFKRYGNGEPDKIILVGDENSYLCLKLNF